MSQTNHHDSYKAIDFKETPPLLRTPFPPANPGQKMWKIERNKSEIRGAVPNLKCIGGMPDYGKNIIYQV